MSKGLSELDFYFLSIVRRLLPARIEFVHQVDEYVPTMLETNDWSAWSERSKDYPHGLSVIIIIKEVTLTYNVLVTTKDQRSWWLVSS